jgi:hypothetical protein
MTLQGTMPNSPSRLGLILSASLASFIFCASNAFARDFEFPGTEHCEAINFNGSPAQMDWSEEVAFRFADGKLSAIRYLHFHPGKEIYVGFIGSDGSVRISGDGARDKGDNRWNSYFQGRLATTGATVLSGELRVRLPDDGHRMRCSISFQVSDGQLRTRLGPLLAVPSRRPAPATTPAVVPSPSPTSVVISPTPVPQAAPPAPPILVVNNPPPAVPTSIVITDDNAASVNKHLADLQGQIDVLTKVLAEQAELQKTAGGDQRPSVDKAIEAVNAQLERLRSEHSAIDKSFGVYLTSVKPNDRDLYLSARKASETYPRIPYYIPGTSETGEFWIEPTVSDRGELQFGFKFVYNHSSEEKVRETIVMTLPEIEDAQKALFKLQAWSEIAHQQKLRRNYEKRVTCFPVSECPPDGERVDGNASTEIRFNVYEDGSTAGRIQRNKGLFVEGYNVSIDSAMALQAYLSHVIKEARIEYNSGTEDKKALDDLFH